MKKLFISVPMKGRDLDNLQKSFAMMHYFAEHYFGESLEVINSFVFEPEPECKHPDVWRLSESIKRMADADYFIGVYEDFDFDGCNSERMAARFFGEKNFVLVNYEAFCADVYMKRRIEW